MFTKAIASALLLASSALALTINSAPFTIAAGQSVTITYTADDANAPVTLQLKEGPAVNLQTVQTLTTTSTGGSFTFTVDPSLSSNTDYAFEILQGSAINFWGPITLTGGASAVSSAPSMPATSSMAASSSPMSMASISTRASMSSMASASMTPASSMSTMMKNGTATSTVHSTASANATVGVPTASNVPYVNMAATQMASPVALIFGAVAALFYL